MQDKLSNQVKITNKRVRMSDNVLYSCILLFSAGILLMTVYFIGYILVQGIPRISLEFIATAPNPVKDTIGIFPSIINTLYMIILSLLIAVPLGVGSAIYINEYAKNRALIKVIETATEILSGIPSIIFGVFGYVFFCQLFRLNISILAGALTLTIMVLPVIMRSTQEALKAVPMSYREGAMGLGSARWHMIRTILLPSSSAGIFTSIILAIGRIVGESAALILVAGGSAMYMPKGNIGEQIMSSGSTLSVELYRYAYSRGDNEVAFGIAAILMLIVIVLNVLTRVISSKMEVKRS